MFQIFSKICNLYSFHNVAIGIILFQYDARQSMPLKLLVPQVR